MFPQKMKILSISAQAPLCWNILDLHLKKKTLKGVSKKLFYIKNVVILL